MRFPSQRQTIISTSGHTKTQTITTYIIAFNTPFLPISSGYTSAFSYNQKLWINRIIYRFPIIVVPLFSQRKTAPEGAVTGTYLLLLHFFPFEISEDEMNAVSGIASTIPMLDEMPLMVSMAIKAVENM